MIDRPRTIVVLMLLWILLAGIFLFYGVYSLSTVIDVPEWSAEAPDVGNFQNSFEKIIPIIHFGFLMSTVIFLVFSSVFVIFAYGTYRKEQWVWTTGLIISTIFLAIFSLMLASFMVNVMMFKDDFSISGLVSITILFLTDLGVIFYLTRPGAKLYFETE